MTEIKYQYQKIFGGVRVRNLDTGGEADVQADFPHHEANVAHIQGSFDIEEAIEATKVYYPNLEVKDGRK